MSNSFSAEVWLNEHRWNALEEALAKQGTSIEKYLQTYLVDLYREMVPEDQVKEIEAIIHQENLEDQREREARKVFSVFRLLEKGKDHCLVTESSKEFLDAARLLRKYLQDGAGGAEAFVRKIQGGYEIPASRFMELMQERLENTGRVAGVFELDFDKQSFSAVNIMDGWKSYWFQDVTRTAERRLNWISGNVGWIYSEFSSRMTSLNFKESCPFMCRSPSTQTQYLGLA